MKFAYLIMAHHRFDVLKLLLKDLDDERNDIFLHIDRKTKSFDEKDIRNTVKKSTLIIVKRIPVFWGDYSQIRCELNLLSEATNYMYHDYYHLLVGVEFPLKTQDKIHLFFEENKGHEFIGYNNEDIFIDRIQYYYFCKKYIRTEYKTKLEAKLNALGDCLLGIQKKIGVNRVKNHEKEYRKGYANWSITHELACYILSKQKEIKHRYHHTMCADEVFIHTLVYHSKFYDKVYDKKDEYNSVMRYTTWEDPHNQLHMSDLPMLLQLDKLFARKFDDEQAIEIIEHLKKAR